MTWKIVKRKYAFYEKTVWIVWRHWPFFPHSCIDICRIQHGDYRERKDIHRLSSDGNCVKRSLYRTITGTPRGSSQSRLLCNTSCQVMEIDCIYTHDDTKQEVDTVSNSLDWMRGFASRKTKRIRIPLIRTLLVFFTNFLVEYLSGKALPRCRIKQVLDGRQVG